MDKYQKEQIERIRKACKPLMKQYDTLNSDKLLNNYSQILKRYNEKILQPFREIYNSPQFNQNISNMLGSFSQQLGSVTKQIYGVKNTQEIINTFNSNISSNLLSTKLNNGGFLADYKKLSDSLLKTSVVYSSILDQQGISNIINNFSNQYLDLVKSLNITIPSDAILKNMDSSISTMMSAVNLYCENYEDNEIDTESIDLNFEFPDNISIAQMNSVINGEEIDENVEFDLKQFNREMLLIDFSNNLNDVLYHFSNAFMMADYCLDNSIKEKLYQSMIDGAITIIADGLVVIGFYIIFVILNHCLRDSLIARSFFGIAKEAKKIFKD